MKILPFTIPKSKNDLLILQEDIGGAFYDQLHQHKELQLSYIEEGEGTLIVGDTISFYQKGDIIVLGENLPHVFISDSDKTKRSKMLSIFFTKASFGHDFFNIEELKELRSFFEKSEHGFRVTAGVTGTIALFEQLFKVRLLQRFILFFQLLAQINKSKIEGLSSFSNTNIYGDRQGRRMSAVFEYTINNFQHTITLEEIAQEAAMTKNAFCKYFKKCTNKTYVTFLNEMRIEESCKLISRKNELSMAEIAELSGFQNISNFNRKFKQIKNKTPREFRKENVL
jgi:AraC-like DNA-binding protein